MTVLQLFLALPVAALGVALFHDFMAGLGEDRLWGRPFPDDMEKPLAAQVEVTAALVVKIDETPTKAIAPAVLKRAG